MRRTSHGRLITAIACAATAAGLAAVPATAAAPTAATGSATSVTSTSATLNGSVNPGGVASSYRFNYGTTSLNQSTPTQSLAAGSTATPVSAGVAGLVPGTKYSFQLVVLQSSNPPTPALGSTATFTTSGPPSADAVTGAATGTSPSGATLGGTVNPHGGDALYEFQFGTTTSYGQTTPARSIQASGPTAVSVAITGLKAASTYHYRIVELLGSYPSPLPEYGADKTFTAGTGSGSGKYGVASLTGKRLKVSHGIASISMKCTGRKGAQCRGRVSVSSRGKSCGAGTLASSTGHTHVIKGRLSAGCATLLKRAKGHRLAATLTATFTTHQSRLKTSVTLVG